MCRDCWVSEGAPISWNAEIAEAVRLGRKIDDGCLTVPLGWHAVIDDWNVEDVDIDRAGHWDTMALVTSDDVSLSRAFMSAMKCLSVGQRAAVLARIDGILKDRSYTLEEMDYDD